VLQAIMHADEHSVNYQAWFLAVCATGVTLIVVWLLRVPYEPSDEEQLQEARDHQGRTIPHELSDSPSPLGITR
jgi:hypothetical protein